MKKMKLLSMICAMLVFVGMFAGCSKKEETTDDITANVEETKESDLSYIKEKGSIIVGITDFAPMDYQDEKGEWIGFDADMAKAFAEYLGVEAEFQIIDWDNKVMELDGKNIDLVWNGMTLTDEVKSSMECSKAYCNNAQVVILPKTEVDKYPDAESLSGLKFAVETGSAGQQMAEENNFDFTEVQDQATTLLEMKSGNVEAAIIDSLMAAAMVGDGTSYSDFTYSVQLNSEEYGVGFRKGSDVAQELNNFFKQSYDDGSMMECAEKYGVQAAIIAQ